MTVLTVIGQLGTNDSQVWSNNTVGTAPFYEWVNGFNGLQTVPGVNGDSSVSVYHSSMSGTLLVT